MKQKLKYLAVGTLGVLFSLLFIETTLQLLNKPKQHISGWNDCKKPGECNYLGSRGKEIEYFTDDFVVILLGDSMVASWGVPFEQIPERRLEHYLKNFRKNIKVFTLGTHGYGQDQEFLLLKEYFKKHRADLVLLLQSTATDITDNIFPASGRKNRVKPTFWLESDQLYGPTEKWMEPVGPRIKLVLLWKAYFGKSIGENRIEKWKKDILPSPYKPFKQYDGEVDYSWQEKWNKSPLTAYKGIEYERVGGSTKWTPRSEMREYGIKLTRKLFSEIKKLTEANNGRFIIFKEERPWEMEDAGKDKAYLLNGNYYIISMRQYHDNLKELFDGFEHYRIPLHMENYMMSVEDFHLNQKAIDKLMKELSLIISNKEYFK